MNNHRFFCVPLIGALLLLGLTPAYATICGNGHGGAPSAPPTGGSGSGDPNGNGTGANIPDPNQDGDPFVPTTGNDHRAVVDVQLFSGVGDHKLTFKRYANSRYSSSVNYFGTSGNYRHSYQWEMVSSGTNSYSIYYPTGAIWTFSPVAGSPGQYASVAACPDRLFQNGSGFVLQKSNGYQFFFQPVGSGYQMAFFRDPHGSQYNLNYDSLSRVTQVTEPAGRYIALNYSGSTLASVQTSDGRSVNYNYNNFTDKVTGKAYPAMVKADYPDGRHAQYDYDQPISKTRPVAVKCDDPHYKYPFSKIRLDYQTNSASISGQITQQSDLDTALPINQLGQIAPGNTTCPTVSEPGAISAQRSYWVNETNGLIQWKSDGLGKRTYYTYDQNGNGFINSKKDANGHIQFLVNSPYGNPLVRTNADTSVENWSRDAQDRVLSYTDALSNSYTYNRDANGLVTNTLYPDGTAESYTYNGFNQVVTYTLRNGGTYSYSYDSRGLLASKTDPLGNTTSYTYDSLERVSGITDALGHTTQMSYNDEGKPTQLIHPDGTAIAYSYDTYGNLTNTVDESGASWSKTYDSYHQVTSATDPLDNTTTYGYFAVYHNLPNQVTLPSGKQTVIGYDSAFHTTNVIKGYGTADAATNSFVYDPAGNVTSMIDGDGHTWKYTYDSRNRKVSETDPLNNKTQYAYDGNGNLIKTTRPDGKVTTNLYDALNRLIKTTDYLGNVTQMTYDASGNLLSLTDPKGNVYSYTYDLLNRRLSTTYPDGASELWSYDAVGNLSSYTTRAGQVCSYTYDSRNRNTGYTWSDGTPGNTKTYDVVGRVLTQSNGNSTISYTYDFAGRELSETQAITGQPSRTVSYTYDGDGNRITLAYPNAWQVGYNYNGRNLLSSITSNLSNSVASYTYDGVGNRVTKTLGNGVVVNYTRDNANRLTAVTNAVYGTALPVVGYQYTLNSVGLRTAIKETTPLFSRTNSFAYDANLQLTNANYAGGGIGIRTFSYDANGNRTATSKGATNTVIPYLVNNLNEYTQVGSLLVSHDRNGNLTTDEKGNIYSYDAQNRLITATSGSTTVTFAYDAQNRVVSRTVNGSSSYFVYDGWKLIEDYDGTGTEDAYYVQGPGDDEPLTRNPTLGQTSYYHQDGNGNVTAMTDASGNVIEHYAYDPFGNVTITGSTGTVLSGSSVGNRFLFTGREYIAEIGLYDYRNRVYSPGLGRFLQTDPIRFNAGDVNIYRYVWNSPVNEVDPYGEWTGQIGIGVNIQLGNFSLNVSFGVAFDGHGNIKPYTTGGGGAGIGANGEAGITGAWSNADCVNDLQGPFQTNSAGGGEGVNGSFETFGGTGSHGQPVIGGGITVGAGAGGGAWTGVTATKIW